MELRRRFLLSVLILSTSPFSNWAATLHVSHQGDASDGLSWETALNRVGDAIAASASGDQIWVASGTYNEANILKEGLSLYGGFIGTETETLKTRDWKANETILDGTGLAATVINCSNQCVIDGFSVVNAYFRGPRFGVNSGGGFRLRDVDDVVIRNCRISNNVLIPPTDTHLDSGGGIYALNSSLRVIKTHIIRNCASSGGGAFFDDSKVWMENCLIDENRYGGGIGMIVSFISMSNCTFGSQNQNSFSEDGQDLEVGGCAQLLVLQNTILRKTDIQGCGQNSINAQNSNIPNVPGNGNIDEDPLWVDPENGDYRLLPNSPCIDSGTDVKLTTDIDGNPRPVDVIGTGKDGPGAFDIGAYEFQLSPADLDANGVFNPFDLFLFQKEWMKETEASGPGFLPSQE